MFLLAIGCHIFSCLDNMIRKYSRSLEDSRLGYVYRGRLAASDADKTTHTPTWEYRFGLLVYLTDGIVLTESTVDASQRRSWRTNSNRLKIIRRSGSGSRCFPYLTIVGLIGWPAVGTNENGDLGTHVIG